MRRLQQVHHNELMIARLNAANWLSCRPVNVRQVVHAHLHANWHTHQLATYRCRHGRMSTLRHGGGGPRERRSSSSKRSRTSHCYNAKKRHTTTDGGWGGPNLNVGLHLLTYSFALLPFHRCNALDQLVLMLNKHATVHTNWYRTNGQSLLSQ